jgi:hypothetical protein
VADCENRSKAEGFITTANFFMVGQKRITHAREKPQENQAFAGVAFAGLHLEAMRFAI